MKNSLLALSILFSLSSLGHASCPETKGRKEIVQELHKSNEVEAVKAFNSFCKNNSAVINCETRVATENEKAIISKEYLKDKPCGIVVDKKSEKNTSTLFLFDIRAK